MKENSLTQLAMYGTREGLAPAPHAVMLPRIPNTIARNTPVATQTISTDIASKSSATTVGHFTPPASSTIFL